jgi:hypothetical protein
MSVVFGDEKFDQDVRDCLLKYYSSETVAHGGYILTIAIIIFAVIAAKQFIPATITVLVPLKTDVCLLSIFLTLGSYFAARTVYWGTLTGYAIHRLPISEEEALKRMPSASIGLLYRISESCYDQFRSTHPIWNFFVGGRENQLKTFAKYLPVFVFILLIGSNI